MSYEGYIQTLCKEGHYNQFEDRVDLDLKSLSCPHCQSRIDWVNSVDAATK